jgi:hypothetical protein
LCTKISTPFGSNYFRKFTKRLENRLSSKTIKVLLSKRKLKGRKRIAFDNNVHKIAIFSDELENVKQIVHKNINSYGINLF